MSPLIGLEGACEEVLRHNYYFINQIFKERDTKLISEFLEDLNKIQAFSDDSYGIYINSIREKWKKKLKE